MILTMSSYMRGSGMAPYLFHDPMWHWKYGSVRVGESIQERGRVEHRSVLSSISLCTVFKRLIVDLDPVRYASRSYQ